LKHTISLKTKNVIGSLTLSVATALALGGCAGPGDEQSSETPQAQETQNKILTIEEKSEGQYVIVDEALTDGPNKAIIHDLNGTTRVLNEEEMKELAAAEMTKVENGTSNLTAPPKEEDEGFGMGEMLLAGAAGALLGGLAASALSNNQNYQANQDRYNQSPAYQERRMNSMGGMGGGGKTAPSSSTSKQNFFGGSSSSSTTSSTTSTTKSSSSSFFGG
jgi:hypothetical protein